MEIFIIRDGEQHGPFDEGTVQTLLKDGGARPHDMAWRKGMAKWMPLGEVIAALLDVPKEWATASGAEHMNGKAPEHTMASARQKALLSFLGARFEDSVTREEAALAISDAMENPKFQSRIRKWQDEKLRLHADLFQDEIDFRKAGRTGRYLELVQTDAAEVLADVTKAHVQVIMESLDKRHPAWEADSRAALWDYLIPALGEHFPQLAQPAFKGRLKVGSTPVTATASAALSSAAQELSQPSSPPGTLAAMWRGIFLGVVALGAIVGVHRIWTEWQAHSSKTAASKPAAAEVEKQSASTPATPAAPPARDKAELESSGPSVSAALPEPKLDSPPVVSPKPAPNEAPEAPKPETPKEAPAGERVPAMTDAPAPATAPAAESSAPASEPAGGAAAPTVAPPAPSPQRTAVTLVQQIGVGLPSGMVTLPVGTRLRLLATEGQNVRVEWSSNVFLVPAVATDLPSDAIAGPPSQASPPQKPADSQ